ncbi:methyltransferase [Nitratireductor rhodophyticola]|uniref:methyltransferase n=1 Tax=Nitratireductor rhodophyticola TaxID=2854036 RepID=UPI002AC9B1DF|nr:methyltransferase [Nitratireductor rhodophyticola]WPZ13233.1 methyltransferase [Nitratireductor rhodophyticola]
MAQNTSSAVMQQRSESMRSLDDFPTPPWATRALCEHLCDSGHRLDDLTCREPAANRGYMVRPLTEYFGRVHASDIHDYGMGWPVEDFLFPYQIDPVDWTITNPPFTLADQFVSRALDTSKIGCAVILRSAFLEGCARYDGLFSQRPPALVLQFVERVPMVKGMVDPSASSATAYSWLVWVHGVHDTRLRWIPPCRKRLERPEDYQAEAA